VAVEMSLQEWVGLMRTLTGGDDARPCVDVICLPAHYARLGAKADSFVKAAAVLFGVRVHVVDTTALAHGLAGTLRAEGREVLVVE
jgi:hypothetical protein